MSGLMYALIFGAFYPLMTLTVACLGTFGIAANKSDRVALAKSRQEFPSSSSDFWFRRAYGQLLWADIWRVIACALFWPIGVPMYLSWKKGAFINDALAKRAAAADSA